MTQFNTEEMSPLLFQSSEEPDEIFDEYFEGQKTEIQQQNINLPSKSSTTKRRPSIIFSQIHIHPTNDNDDDDDDTIIENVLKSSSEVEILSCGQKSPIILSSETPIDNSYLQRSPDLFGSQDDNLSDHVTSQKLINEQGLKSFENMKVSTPFFLVKPKVEFDSQVLVEDDVPEANINDTNVFEITTNDEFPNMIRINSDTEMSPIRVSPDNLNADETLPLSLKKTPNISSTKSDTSISPNKSFSFLLGKQRNLPSRDQSDNSIEIIDDFPETPKSSKKRKSESCLKTPSTSSSKSDSSITPNGGKWLRKRGFISEKAAWNESIKRRNLQKLWFGDDKMMEKLEKMHTNEAKKNDVDSVRAIEDQGSESIFRRSGRKKSSLVSRKSKSLWSSDDEF